MIKALFGSIILGVVVIEALIFVFLPSDIPPTYDKAEVITCSLCETAATTSDCEVESVWSLNHHRLIEVTCPRCGNTVERLGLDKKPGYR